MAPSVFTAGAVRSHRQDRSIVGRLLAAEFADALHVKRSKLHVGSGRSHSLGDQTEVQLLAGTDGMIFDQFLAFHLFRSPIDDLLLTEVTGGGIHKG